MPLIQDLSDLVPAPWTDKYGVPSPNYVHASVAGVGISTLPPGDQSTVTGVNPNEIAKALYNKTIPISALGLARIGGRCHFGPYFASGRTIASFGISFGFPANPEGTRELREIAFDDKVVWTLADGFVGEFLGSSFIFRFYPGTYTQDADALEYANFPDQPVAYRPQFCIFFEGLPITSYGKREPFVAAVIGDTTDAADPTDGITIGTALERVEYSPWVGKTVDDFETVDVTDVIQALIIDSNISTIELEKGLGRMYRNLDIIQTDKLRIVDRGANVTADLTVDRTNILSASSGPSVVYSRQDPNDLSRELELITIDPDADYIYVASTAKRPRDPVAVTTSVGKESVTLPIVINALTRQALVTYAKYQEEQARRRVTLSLMIYALEIEPGDLIDLSSLGSGFEDEIFKVIETLHGANHVVQCTLESIFQCSGAGTSSFIGGTMAVTEGADSAAMTGTVA